MKTNVQTHKGDVEKNKPDGSEPPVGQSHTIWASVNLITPKDENPSPQPKVLKYIDSLTSLFKALGWPVIVLLIFLMLRGQLYNFFEQLPYSQSTKFAIGSFTFEVKQAARQVGNPALAKLLEGLSPDALETLMQMRGGYAALVSYSPDHGEYTVEADKVINIYKELEKNGLVQFRVSLEQYTAILKELGLEKTGDASYRGGSVYKPTKTLDQSQQEKVSSFGAQLTPTGEKALDIITAVVVQQFQHPKQDVKEDEEK